MGDTELTGVQIYAQRFRKATTERIGTDEAAVETILTAVNDFNVRDEFENELGGKGSVERILSEEFSLYEERRVLAIWRGEKADAGDAIDRISTGAFKAISDIPEAVHDHPWIAGGALVLGLLAAKFAAPAVTIGALAFAGGNAFFAINDLADAALAGTSEKRGDAFQNLGRHTASVFLVGLPLLKGAGNLCKGAGASASAARATGVALGEAESVATRSVGVRVAVADLGSLTDEATTLPEAGPVITEMSDIAEIAVSGSDTLNRNLFGRMITRLSQMGERTYIGEAASSVSLKNGANGSVEGVSIRTVGRGHADEIAAEIRSWMQGHGVRNPIQHESIEGGRRSITLWGVNEEGRNVRAVVIHAEGALPPFFPGTRYLDTVVTRFNALYAARLEQALNNLDAPAQMNKAWHAHNAMNRLAECLQNPHPSQKEMEQMMMYHRILTRYALENPVPR